MNPILKPKLNPLLGPLLSRSLWLALAVLPGGVLLLVIWLMGHKRSKKRRSKSE